MAKAPKGNLSVEALKHDDATRKNIPTAEYQSVMKKDEQSPIRLAYERRNRDLDPQLIWRGKDQQDWSDLVVHAPPLYIQEKIHPKALMDDLLRQSAADAKAADAQIDLFADFNGLPDDNAKTEFYQHDAHWANRMILGDSLQVMASLAEREGLRGQVQCIYFDPPYGIKFNSNFQWSTTSRDVTDGKADHITREPEQVKAFRDTWRDGIHSYLTYLRDRLTVARDLLTESGSIFVQISDENVHRVRAVMDEVFGEPNFVNTIVFKKKSATYSTETVFDYLIWYCRNREQIKVRDLYDARSAPEEESKFNTVVTPDLTFHNVSKLSDFGVEELIKRNGMWARVNYPIVSQHPSDTRSVDFLFRGKNKTCGGNKQWRFGPDDGMRRLEKADRLFDGGGASLGGVVYWNDWNQVAKSNIWADMHGEKFPTYVVQTTTLAIQRCILMTSDPGDLVLDPTCGSGTTAYVAEQWGRRWITLDTSRVALALARARIMGARYPYYLLADSRDGQIKEAEITRTAPSSQPTRGNLRYGFVYERVPHITLKSIANNAEIDIIWDQWQAKLEPLREQLNQSLGKHWQEWEIPRDADAQWPDATRTLHADWWQARIARQKEIDASIAAKADYEYLYDKPYEDKKRVRVAGPFTVESLSPHRVLAVDENDELIDKVAEPEPGYGEERDFVQMILENLKTAGVQQAHKEDKISLTALMPWPGKLVCAEGRYEDAGGEKRAAIFIGPEFGTVSRPDLVEAAREAGDADFDVLIACAFNYDAHSSEFNKLGRIPVLKARMNAELHMAEDLKNTGKGNLFVIFGEPDITLLDNADGSIRVKVNGVDVFHPQSGEIRSDGPDGIACWFIDTDYNMESFFVRHAYFLGANDPYKALKTTLKAEINEEAWATLNSDTSRSFAKPKSGRIAVKVINHLGDEVMKVFRVAPGT
ncbi:MAG: site-specific DNA-methyltransferase [Candidatus Contendobacter sp.]|jgi:adenine-specific DNA-methyltransferase|nr:site-specific DNA-methyltransferase [Gammaproteobacteria bacterium]MCC8993929.1 site-specific DNA-methyltransferase [Candidatus Contendobacter sp.]